MNRRVRIAGVWCALLAAWLAWPVDSRAKGTTIPAELFWQHPARATSGTLLLWSFDGDAAAAPDAGPDQHGLADDPEGGGPVGKLAGMTGDGDAAIVPEGRFGKGMRLNGHGRLLSTELALGTDFGEDGQLTITWWVKPAAAQREARATLLSLPGPTPLDVRRAADGTLALAAGDTDLLTTTRTAAAERWTYLTLVLGRNGAAALLVNGTRSALPANPRIARCVKECDGEIALGAGARFAQPFTGTLDDIRVCKGALAFTELDDDAWTDPRAQRAVAAGTPYFQRADPPLLAMSCDGTITPEVFSGLRVHGMPAPEDFTDGVRGKALNLTAAQKTGIALSGRDLFPLESGTLTCWLRPLDWVNGEFGDENGQGITKMPLLAFATKATAETPAAVRRLSVALGFPSTFAGPFVRLDPGHWYHIALTWEPGHYRCYINGEHMPFAYLSFSGTGADDYRKWRAAHPTDDGSYGLYFFNSHTLIDELQIYPRAWQPQEVANAYARYLPDAAHRLAALPAVTVTSWYDYNYRNLKVSVAARQVDGRDPAAARVTILGKDGAKLAGTELLPLNTAWKADAQVPVELPFGAYTLLVECVATDQQPLGVSRQALERAQPAWWKNTLGVTRAVPAPWTPIAVAGQTLHVWGRALTLEATGLPRSLTSAGQELFAAPARLRVTLNGTTGTLGGTAVAFTETAEDVARWTAVSTVGKLAVTVAGSLEFDGLQRYTVTLDSGAAPLEIGDLVLDFPLKTAVAAQLIANGGAGNFRASHDVRLLPLGAGRVWDSLSSKQARAVKIGNFLPTIWVGDDDRGLCFFGENDQGWTPNGTIPAQEIIRDGDTTLFRLHVICAPVTLHGTRTFTFGIQATPMKPLPADWRTFGRTYTYDAVDAFSGFKLTTLDPIGFGSPAGFDLEPQSWEVAATQAKNMHAKFPNSPLLLYIDHDWPHFGPSMAPEYSNGLWNSGCLCWSPEVVDYYVWVMNEYLKRGLIDGLYIDDTGTRPSAPGSAGTRAYQLPDGAWQNGVNLTGFREFLQRTSALFAQYGKRPRIVAHMTWCFELPAYSFLESALNGEDRTYRFVDKADFMTMWSRDELRIMTHGQKWGFATLWIPEIKDRFGKAGGYDHGPLYDAKLYRQARALHAQCLLTDAWYMFANNLADYVLPALLRFGITEPDVEFLPYWQLDGKATLTAKTTLMSVYRRPGQALLFFSNNGEQDEPVSLTIDPALLRNAPGAALRWEDYDTCLTMPKELATSDPRLLDPGVDGYTGLPDDPPPPTSAFVPAIIPTGNTLSLWVRRHDFRVIVVTGK